MRRTVLPRVQSNLPVRENITHDFLLEVCTFTPMMGCQCTEHTLPLNRLPTISVAAGPPPAVFSSSGSSTCQVSAPRRFATSDIRTAALLRTTKGGAAAATAQAERQCGADSAWLQLDANT